MSDIDNTVPAMPDPDPDPTLTEIARLVAVAIEDRDYLLAELKASDEAALSAAAERDVARARVATLEREVAASTEQLAAAADLQRATAGERDALSLQVAGYEVLFVDQRRELDRLTSDLTAANDRISSLVPTVDELAVELAAEPRVTSNAHDVIVDVDTGRVDIRFMLDGERVTASGATVREALRAAIALARTPDPDPDPDPPPPPAWEPTTIAATNGFYPGSFWSWDPTPPRFVAAENQLGQPIPFTTVMLNRQTPQLCRASSFFLGAPDRLWKHRDRVRPIVTVPLAFGRDPDNLERTAAGENDDLYRWISTLTLPSGRGVFDYRTPIARIGHESNGEWCPWSSVGRIEAFIRAWRHVAGIFLAVRHPITGAQHWQTEWNQMFWPWFEGVGPESYPGDDVVTYCGMDMYRKGNRRPDPAKLLDFAAWAANRPNPKRVGFSEVGFGDEVPGRDEGDIVDDASWVHDTYDALDVLAATGQLAYFVPFSPADRDWLETGPTAKLPLVNAAWRARAGVPR